MGEVKEHPVSTRRRQLRYQFTPKHHGQDVTAAQWVLELTDEFAVFDAADWHDLSDDGGNLFGLIHDGTQWVMLGTREEQVAKFPAAPTGAPWHGYPVWPLAGQADRPPKAVLTRMRDTGVITEIARKRLMAGKHL